MLAYQQAKHKPVLIESFASTGYLTSDISLAFTISGKMVSKYFKLLSGGDRKQYKEKLTFQNRLILSDPYALVECLYDITKFPNVSSSDINK